MTLFFDVGEKNKELLSSSSSFSKAVGNKLPDELPPPLDWSIDQDLLYHHYIQKFKNIKENYIP